MSGPLRIAALISGGGRTLLNIDDRIRRGNLDGTISDSRVAFCAFQKKPEFGRGSIVAERIELSGIEREHLIEPGSSLTLDGREIEEFQEGVKELLYGAEYGRESN